MLCVCTRAYVCMCACSCVHVVVCLCECAYKPSYSANTNFEESNRTPPTDDSARRHSSHSLVHLKHSMDLERAMRVHTPAMLRLETVCHSRTTCNSHQVDWECLIFSWSKVRITEIIVHMHTCTCTHYIFVIFACTRSILSKTITTWKKPHLKGLSGSHFLMRATERKHWSCTPIKWCFVTW